MFVASSRRFLNRHFSPSYFFDGDNNQSQNQNNSSSQPDYKALAAAAVSEVLSKKDNDSQAALLTLAGRNVRLEQRAKDAEAKVLSDADRANLTAANALLQATGAKDFDEVKVRLESGDRAVQVESQRAKADKRSAAVAADGFSAEKVALLSGIDGFEFEERSVTVDGKEAKTGHAKGKLPDGSDFDGRVSDLLSKIAAPILDGLKAGEAKAPGLAFPALATTGTQSKGTVWDNIRAEKAAKAEPAVQPVPWTKQLGLGD